MPEDKKKPQYIAGTKIPKGLLTRGNIDLNSRPVVRNPDGTVSSEYSVSFADDKGHEVLVPTVVGGKFLTPDGHKPPEGSPEEEAMQKRAWDHYLKTGQHMGIFDTPENADAYADVAHKRNEPVAPPPLPTLPKAAEPPVKLKPLPVTAPPQPQAEAPIPEGSPEDAKGFVAALTRLQQVQKPRPMPANPLKHVVMSFLGALPNPEAAPDGEAASSEKEKS